MPAVFGELGNMYFTILTLALFICKAVLFLENVSYMCIALFLSFFAIEYYSVSFADLNRAFPASVSQVLVHNHAPKDPGIRIFLKMKKIQVLGSKGTPST
jgi:hypothetical protein